MDKKPEKVKAKAVEPEIIPAPPKTKLASAKPKSAVSVLINSVLEGDETAQLLGSDGLAIKVRGVISTQCATIDHAIGRGGIPLGRLTILHGGEGSGKTTLALQIVAECQRIGGMAVYIDKEYKLDPEYAAKLGVDTANLILKQPDHLEGIFAYHETLIDKVVKYREATKQRVPVVVVLDSMNAAITKAEFVGEWEDQHMAPQARVYSRLLPKLIPQVHKEDIALLWISQIRKKMNIQYGDDNEIAGGNAARFYASLILDVKKVGMAKEGDEKVGSKVVVYCKKNQIAIPFKSGEIEISYGRGADRERSLLVLAEQLKIVKTSGSWVNFGDERVGQGMLNASEALRKDPDMAERIREAIKKATKV